MSGFSATTTRGLVLVILVVMPGAFPNARAESDSKIATSMAFPDIVKAFLSDHCVACHDGEDGEGGLDLTALQGTLDAPGELSRWIRIFDRVHAGEMPPKDTDRPQQKDIGAFLGATRQWLSTHQRAQWQTLGRVPDYVLHLLHEHCENTSDRFGVGIFRRELPL